MTWGASKTIEFFWLISLWTVCSMRTGARPDFFMPMRLAAPRERSITRLPTNGPRSLTRTITLLPVLRVGNLDARAERQCAMGGGETVGVVALTIRSLRAHLIPGGEPEGT